MQLSLLLSLLWIATALAAPSYPFGSYYRPFSAQSPWNSKPVNPVFMDSRQVNVSTSLYFPSITSGKFSTGLFYAVKSDPPMLVYGNNAKGLLNVDAIEYVNNMTIPHWPASTLPATGTDGHCDIYDSTTGMIHSFWQLQKNNNTNRWEATQYAWTSIEGFGFGDPDHYFQGARAAAVVPSAGIIRIHEVDDGLPLFQHALCMSMTYNSLAKDNLGYIYPATAADWDYAKNTGFIPEGALMMLPASFNTSTASIMLRKVIETLKVYGAYVVDRNDGTPYSIFVENNSTFKLYNGSWDNPVAAELQRIRANLLMVDISATSFVDGNGIPVVPRTGLNLLSMRGPNSWYRMSGDSTAQFDTWTQTLQLSASTTNSTYNNAAQLGVNRVSWGSLEVNATYSFGVNSTGGVQIKFVVTNGGTVYDSGFLGNGAKVNFTLPKGSVTLYVNKPAGPAAYVKGLLYLISAAPKPTIAPTAKPTSAPTTAPTGAPTTTPTGNPTSNPTGNPTGNPTSSPTGNPTNNPTSAPTAGDSTTSSPIGSSAVRNFVSIAVLITLLAVIMA